MIWYHTRHINRLQCWVLINSHNKHSSSTRYEHVVYVCVCVLYQFCRNDRRYLYNKCLPASLIPFKLWSCLAKKYTSRCMHLVCYVFDNDDVNSIHISFIFFHWLNIFRAFYFSFFSFRTRSLFSCARSLFVALLLVWSACTFCSIHSIHSFASLSRFGSVCCVPMCCHRCGCCWCCKLLCSAIHKQNGLFIIITIVYSIRCCCRCFIVIIVLPFKSISFHLHVNQVEPRKSVRYL